MKLRDFSTEQNFQDRLFEIPSEVEVSFRVVSDFEYFAQHYDADKKHFYVCIGEKKGCPFCPDPKIKKRYLTYIKDVQDNIILAALPYGLFKFLRETLDNDPTKFNENDMPNFYVKCFRSGAGLDTVYNYEIDVTDNSEIDISKLDPLSSYIEARKFETNSLVDIKEKEETLNEDIKNDTKTDNVEEKEDINMVVPF
jgi:hypothetical protein